MSDRHQTSAERLTLLRDIVQRRSYRKVSLGKRTDPDGARRTNYVGVDVLTARAILTVYDALSPVNQEKFSALSIPRMADVAWKVIRVSRV